MTIPPDIDERLVHYGSLLYEANRQTNLVSRRLTQDGVVDLVRAHAELLTRADQPGAHRPGGLEGLRLLDIGTGAGLPGLAVKIRHPELEVVLSESRRLRLDCLSHFVDELALEGVFVVGGDVVKAVPREFEDQKFDIVTAFGVGQALEVIGLAAPFLADNARGYLSIPADPEPADIGRWHLEAAFWELRCDVLGACLDGERSVLRLTPIHEG